MVNFAQIKAIEKANKERIIKLNPSVPETSGIYIFTRFENGFKFAYVGQAKNLLNRLAQHLVGYKTKNPTWIDKSIKKHGLWNKDNLTGWNVSVFECSNYEKKEIEYIQKYSNMGFQMRNLTAGGQNEGKEYIYQTERKGYSQGLKNGYANAQKFVANLFKKNLIYSINGKENLNKLKAKEKFKNFLEVEYET